MSWILENWPLLSALVGALIALLLATKWGKANKEALLWLAARVEGRDGIMPVKEGIGHDVVQDLKPSRQDAMKVVADIVDTKKTPESKWKRFGRLAGRMALGAIFRKLG
jgi:hypothetical protein